MKILVTGGGGYVGSILIPLLLEEGYEVRALELPGVSTETLQDCALNPHFEIQTGDIREPEVIEKALHDTDHIIHLAAVVGYPSCEKDLSKARSVNVEATALLAKRRSPGQRLIFPSTLGSYAANNGKPWSEEATMFPKTTYGTLKLEAEKRLLDSGNATILRPASAFGLSPQMRLDSLVNHFVYSALKHGRLEIYEPHAIRPVIHVRDLARSFLWVLCHLEGTRDQAFHVGHESLQLKKQEIAEMIQQKTGCNLRIVNGKDLEERYSPVDFSKIRRAGFDTTVTLEQGVDELTLGLRSMTQFVIQPFSEPE